jgi:hypothetical protein
MSDSILLKKDQLHLVSSDLNKTFVFLKTHYHITGVVHISCVSRSRDVGFVMLGTQIMKAGVTSNGTTIISTFIKIFRLNKKMC